MLEKHDAMPMTERFIGWEADLATLRELAAGEDPPQAIFHTATQQSESIELERFTAAAGRIAGSRIPRWVSFSVLGCGTYFHKYEIDIVGRQSQAITFVGSVKWRKKELDYRILDELNSHAAALPGVTPSTIRLLYGRSEAAEMLARIDNVRSFSAEDL